MEKQDTIIVNLTDLYRIIRQMRKDDMAYVELTISPPEAYEGDVIPAQVALSGIKSSDPDFFVDYESVEAADVPRPRGVMSRNTL